MASVQFSSTLSSIVIILTLTQITLTVTLNTNPMSINPNPNQSANVSDDCFQERGDREGEYAGGPNVRSRAFFIVVLGGTWQTRIWLRTPWERIRIAINSGDTRWHRRNASWCAVVYTSTHCTAIHDRRLFAFGRVTIIHCVAKKCTIQVTQPSTIRII